MTAWPPHRVESLKKAFHDGLSASQAAKRFGVSRAAVCGKWHRLGLKRGAASAALEMTAGARKGRALQRLPRAKAKATPEGLTNVRVAAKGGRTYLLGETKPLPPARDEAPGLATVLTLGAHMCKWPIGDPSSDGFTFCGAQRSGGPYCIEHARVAYQPLAPGKPRTGNELMRALRRYA